MEKLLYSDILNETELLRTLSKSNIKTLGLRILNTYDLVLYIYSKLCIRKEGTYISNEEQDYIYYKLLNPSCFDDAKNIKTAINTFRDSGRGNTANELLKYLNKDFKEKTEVIIDAFNKYNDYKKNNQLYDLYDCLYELMNKVAPLNKELTYYSDLPYSPISILVFKSFFNVKEEKYEDLFKKENQNIDITKCYGKNNELQHVLNTLYLHEIPLDNVLIVLTDQSVITNLTNRLKEYDLPFTTSIGIPFSHTNVGKFVSQIKKMSASDFGVDSYKELFSASFFNKDNYIKETLNKEDTDNFIKYIGFLRQSFDSDVPVIDESLYQDKRRDDERTHNICDALRLITEDINKDKSISSFIKKNVIEDDYHFEALKLLEKYDNYINKYDIPFDVIIDTLLSASIGQHISKSGAIHICFLSQSFSSVREHVFILDLDSSFPGNPKENYLIYDEEYLNMGVNKYLSTEIIKDKERLMRLLITGCLNCHLSYAYYSNIDTKSINPSSVIFNLQNKDIPEFSYENDMISNNTKLIREFNKGILTNPSLIHTLYNYDAHEILSRAYSPSSFGAFFSEDQKLGFILSNILGLNIEEEIDTHEVLSAADRGTLFHKAVENFDKNKCSDKDKFINNGLEIFDNFLKTKPPVIKESATKEREYFKRGLENFYDDDPANKCVVCEHPSKASVFGITFKGAFDRLEVDNQGRYILVDYKTGNTNHHVSNDALSCIQGLIYAALIEQDKRLGNIKVYKCEFRYPFIDDSSYILYDETAKKQLKEMISLFIDSINNHNFGFDETKQKYVDKYEHLISLMKEFNRQDD